MIYRGLNLFPAPLRSKVAVCALIGLFLAASNLNGPSAEEIGRNPAPTENEVRAAFLYNFIKFASWPQKAFTDSREPIVIGIIGHDPFGNLLDSMVKDRTIQSRKLMIRRYPRIEDYADCHVLYIGFNEKRYQVAILQHLNGKPVLTIGAREGFTRLGGMINFVTIQNQVGFEINLDAVEKSNLEISAKLLKLAKIIRP